MVEVPVPERSAGAYVRLTVSDTGVGMSAEVKAQAFDPFFTTKELGKGTGLGLATCYGIVNQNEGHITIDSEERTGTTVGVYLPWAGESATSEPTNGGESVFAADESKRTELDVGRSVRHPDASHDDK